MTLIYHIFADDGVESEALAAHGRVVRVGWDARDNWASEPIRADARSLPLRQVADLAVFHPPCGPWANAPSSYDQERGDHPEYISLSRELGQEYADHYIIENVPKAPLDDPVVLNGRMFGVPTHHERAFETSFSVDEPPMEDDDMEMVYWWNEYTRPKSYWLSAKGYTGEYRKDPLVKAGTPRPFVDWLLRQWQESVRGVGVSASEDSSVDSAAD